jgi:hypothetical protein
MELETNLMDILISDCQVLSLQLKKVTNVRTIVSYDTMQITEIPNANEECQATCSVLRVCKYVKV